MQASTVDKLRSRQLGLLAAFREHIQELQELRRRAEDEFLPEIVKQEGVSDDEMWSLAFLDDDGKYIQTSGYLPRPYDIARSIPISNIHGTDELKRTPKSYC